MKDCGNGSEQKCDTIVEKGSVKLGTRGFFSYGLNSNSVFKAELAAIRSHIQFFVFAFLKLL